MPASPIVIASKAAEARELGQAGFVLPKGDPGSLETLEKAYPGCDGNRRLRPLRRRWKRGVPPQGYPGDLRCLLKAEVTTGTRRD